MAPEDAIMRERLRILRGRILETLCMYRSRAVLDVQITQLESLIRDHRRDEIETQCGYLAEKGYVVDATRRVDHRDRRDVGAVRITAAGIDLVEGTIADEGVVFG